MPATVSYVNFDGMMLMEVRGGVQTTYIPDTLGSLMQCLDASGNKVYEAQYWPYGELRTSTGTNPSPWGFVGLLGYLVETTKRLYVRARHYRADLTRWMTVDPLWPSVAAFTYSFHAPTTFSDPSGAHPGLIVLGGLIGGLEILPILATSIGIAISVILVLLLILGIVLFLRWLCEKIKDVKGNVCHPSAGLPKSCSLSDCCADVISKLAIFQACLDLRALECSVCFAIGGCNDGHKRQIIEFSKRVATCNLILLIKCL